MINDFAPYIPHLNGLDPESPEAMALMTWVHNSMAVLVAAEFDKAASNACGQQAAQGANAGRLGVNSDLNSLSNIYNKAANDSAGTAAA